jgi:hypothetical protein
MIGRPAPRQTDCLTATHAARCLACQGVRSHPVPVALVGEMLHAGRVERRPPAALVVPGELKIVALPRHATRDTANAGPGVEPGSESLESGSHKRASTAPVCF